MRGGPISWIALAGALAVLAPAVALAGGDENGRILGEVTDANSSEPIADVTVQMLDTDDPSKPVKTACTGADGAYVADPVPPGTYYVRYLANGSCGDAGDYLPQYYELANVMEDASPVGLVDGQDVQPVDAALNAGTPPALALNVKPKRKGGKPGRASAFTASVRNRGDAIATDVRVCVSAPRKRARVKGKACAGSTLLAAAQAKRRFKLVPKRSARGKRVKLVFKATSPVAEGGRATAILKVAR